MKQNITLTLEQELVRKARVLAAERGTSGSRLLADELARLVTDAERYERAKAQALADLDRGLHLGAQPAPREALHER
jgi:erythromycin esterase-like protein